MSEYEEDEEWKEGIPGTWWELGEETVDIFGREEIAMDVSSSSSSFALLSSFSCWVRD